MKVGKDCNISSKVSFYNDHMIEIGNNVRIDDFCILSGGSGIKIGNDIHISSRTSLFGGSGITIEDHVRLSTNVQVFSESHGYSGDYEKGHVSICKYAIVGSGTIILPGVTIGEGTAVGALSLVKKNCRPWMLYAGIPARKIGPRNGKN